MIEQQPRATRLQRIKAAGRVAGAVAASAATAVYGNTATAKAQGLEQSASANQTRTYLATGNPDSFLKKVKISNREETVLLQEIRTGKHPAFLLNGAIEFHGPTTDYLGPVDKSDRVPFHASPSGQERVLYYPLATRVGDTIYVASLDTNHQVANVGQGSLGENIGWTPLDGANYTVWRNTADQAPALMSFNEVYDAHPMGLNAPTQPVYDLASKGTNPKLPAIGSVMDTEAWPKAQAQADLKAIFTPLSSQESEGIFASLGKS